MREFIYYSENARTSGNFPLDNLMKAGRMDIACNIIIMGFFISHHIRDDVKIHLIFNGPPDSPKHLEMFPGKNIKLAKPDERVEISKKDVAGLIKKMLYKYRKGIKNEIYPGYSIEKKSFFNVVTELGENKNIYILDKRGKDIRELKDNELKNSVFILGDQEGLPKKELKLLKKIGIKKVGVGKQMYFASQTMTIVQNELDRREIK